MASKTAIYVRVSTHYQIDKDSLQVQKRELIAYTQLVLGIQDYEIFEDAGFSAKNTERPEYQAMMQRIRSGEFSHILVWKIDRISRNLLDFSEMYGELKKYGVIFVSKNEQFDTSSAIGEAMLKIILVFAELERKMTAERVTAVMLSRANVGKWNGGRVPYGYIRTKDGFALDPVTSLIAEQIFELYSTKQSTLEVSRYLNSHGYRTSTDSDWTTTSVHKILTNIWYVGDYRYNVHKDGKGTAKKEKSEWVIFPDHHVPLISRTKFDYVQAKLKQNQRGTILKGKTYERKNTHIFAGVLKCALCGTNMSSSCDRRRANGFVPSSYACANKRNKTCANKFIADTTLAPQVFQYLANMMTLQIEGVTTIAQAKEILKTGNALQYISDIDDAGVSQTLKNLSEEDFKPLWSNPDFEPDKDTIDITTLKSKLRKLSIALDRLKALYLYSDSGMSESEYTIEKAKIESEAMAIEKQLAESMPTPDNSSEEFMEQASALILIDLLSNYDEKRFMSFLISANKQICKSFINACIASITIADGKMTSITFKNGATHILEHKKSDSD